MCKCANEIHDNVDAYYLASHGELSDAGLDCHTSTTSILLLLSPSTSVYTKASRLMANGNVMQIYVSVRLYYALLRNDIVYVCITVRLSRDAQGSMNFSSFRRLVS